MNFDENNDNQDDFFEEFDSGYGKSPPKPDPDHRQGLCNDHRFDFTDSHWYIKQFVFWFSGVMLILNVLFLVVMLIFILTRATALDKASFLTKIQFMLLILINTCSIAQLAMYMIV